MEEKQNFKKWRKIVFLGIILYWALFNLKTVGNIVSSIISIVFPLLLGAFIALVLNVPMRFFEAKFKGKNKKEKVTLFERGLAILLSLIIIIFVITLVINLIVPELIKVVRLLINNIPYYREELNNLFAKAQISHPEFDFTNIQETLNTNLDNIANSLINNLPNLMSSSFKIVKGVFSGIAQTFIALVFAFYILTGKDKLRIRTEKFAKAYLKEKAERALRILNLLLFLFDL